MKIYRNGVEIYEIKDFKVTGRFMEVAILDCAIKSPIPIAFKIGDYVTYDYNNLTYSLYDIPVPKKQARSGSYGEAFIYNLKFKSNMEHLVICPFLDLVANDNTLHYTSLPSFSTFENVYGIAARIQANMDYLYPGKWRIVVGETSDSELLETLNEAKEFAISGQSCFEGLRKIYDTWGVGYIYSEAEGINTITIGKSAGTTSVFRYGKGQGLRTIGKNIQNNDQFCTRAYVFGSTRNLPARWYNEKGYIGEAQYAPNLMIPFSKWVGGIPQGAYIDAIFGEENRVEKYGLRIKTFSYDGSGNNEEIYPSIEKVTAGNIRSAKAELGETKYIPSSRYSDSERMDYILGGSNISDDGVSVEAGYELYSEKLTATTKEVEETLIIAEPLKEEKYNRLEFQKNIPVCSFEITKLANYRITEVNDMVSFSKNDLESTINAKWYIQTPDGSYIDLNKSLTFTDKLNASLQLPDTNFNAREVGKYTLTLRLSIGWSVDYVVPQIDGDIFLKYSFSGDNVVIARGTGILDSTFTLKLKQIGFDINSVTASDGSKKTITMKDGMCGGRSFVINQCKYSASDDSWELVCSRTKDVSVSQMFPNSIFPISTGDQFVLLNINMPDLYVYTAMQRLYDTALADLKHYSLPQFVVSPEIDNLQMARSPQILREGMYMPIEDSDIDIDEEILIDSVTITEKGTELRSFYVTLRNDKIYNRFSKIATSISSLESSIEEAKKNAANTTVVDDSSTEVFVNSNTTSNYFELTENDEVKVKEERPLIGKEARFESVALPKEAPAETKEGEVYGFISDRSNAAVDLTPLLKRINVGTEDNPQWAVIPIDYNGNPVGIVSDTFITAGGRNGDSSGQGSATTLGGLVNVDDTADDLQTEDVVLVKGVDATHWTLRALSTLGLNKTELESYLTTNSYLKKDTADGLYAPLASFNTLNTKVNDFLTGTDTDSIINKWKELEAFLAGQTETSTLADLLAVKADKTALQAHIDNYNYFVGTTYAAHISAYNTHITEYNTFKDDTQRRLNALEALWAIDEENNGLYPKSGRGIWSESYITAGGVGTSEDGSGGGLIQTVYGYNSLGGTFDNTVLTDTFNAYTINYLYTEVEKLKSGGSGFSESAMWTALGGSAENKVIASEHIPDLSGKYLPLGGGVLTSSRDVVLGLDTTHYRQNVFLLLHKGVYKTQLGYVDGFGSYIFDYTTSKYLGIDNNGAPYFGVASDVSSSGHYILIHTGNISNQIVSRARYLLSPYSYEGSAYISDSTTAETVFTDSLSFSAMMQNTTWSNGWSTVFGFSGYKQYGGSELSVEYNALTPRAALRNYNQSLSGWTAWREFAFLDSNVTSATKLQDNTAYTAWGQTFFENGKPKNVSGNIIMNGLSVLSQTSTTSELQLGPGTLENAPIGIYGTDVRLYSGGRNFYPFILTANGNALIGTTTDNSRKLNVYGTGFFTASATSVGGVLIGKTGNTIDGVARTSDTTYYNLYLNYTSNGDVILAYGGGNVGIGTTTPAYKLDVAGTLRATGRIYANEWIQMEGVRGLFFPSTGFGTNVSLYINPNYISSYGGFAVHGKKGDYHGIHIGNTTTGITLMHTGAYGGLYRESASKWLFFANNHNEVFIGNAATEQTGYQLTVAGNTYVNGTLSAGATTVASLTSNGNISATGSTILGYTGRFFEMLPRTDGSSGVYNLGSSDNRWTAYLKSADITGNIRLKPASASYGSYLYFGDGSYCYIAELTDDKMTIYASSGLQITANTDVSGNIYATGAITAGSDARYKSKLQDVAVDVEVIAGAPLFNFVWNDGRKDKKTYLGTTAQYWAQTNFKNAVIPTDNEKLWTMSYSQIAMGNTIVLARELLPIKRKVREIDDLKSRLYKAERKIEALENELKQYRRA